MKISIKNKKSDPKIQKSFIRHFWVFAFLVLFTNQGICQFNGMYPPYTKWYQDPLGIKPLELSTAFGFVWASVATAACLIFTKKDSLLQKNITFYTEVGKTIGYKPPFTASNQNEIGIIFGLRPNMSLGFSLSSYHFKDNINDTYTFGFMPLVKWDLFRSKKVDFYFQYNAGISYSLSIFPLTGTGLGTDTSRYGTKFNFLAKYTIGADYFLTNKIALQVALKHFHLSNGNIKGIERNPSYDGNGLSIGLMYKISKKGSKFQSK